MVFLHQPNYVDVLANIYFLLDRYVEKQQGRNETAHAPETIGARNERHRPGVHYHLHLCECSNYLWNYHKFILSWLLLLLHIYSHAVAISCVLYRAVFLLNPYSAGLLFIRQNLTSVDDSDV